MEDERLNSLPENAQRELKPGEEYKPLLGAEKKWAEVTPYSVALGLLMVVIFSAAAAYLGLRVGQVFEAAIPIAIIAVGLTTALGKKEGLGQNVIIQSIGGCSGAVVAGAIFTLPAIYILGVEVNFMQMFLSSLLGGVLGILFLIPFRKYFVKEMHGKYPFPEATATTQILVSGEGGKGAGTLLVSGLIGGLYDFLVSTFGTWSDTISTTGQDRGRQSQDPPESQHQRSRPWSWVYHRSQICLRDLLRQPAGLACHHPPDESHLGRAGHRPHAHWSHYDDRRDVS